MLLNYEKTLESPLGYKEIQPVHPKGDQSWVFTGRANVDLLPNPTQEQLSGAFARVDKPAHKFLMRENFGR